MKIKVIKWFLLSVICSGILFVTPHVAKAWPIQVDVFTRDVNGNKLTNLPIDYNGAGYWDTATNAQCTPGFTSTCQSCFNTDGTQNTNSKCFRLNGNDATFIPDIWPGYGASTNFYTVDPSYGGFSDAYGGWTTLRTAYGFDFNCAYSPLKEIAVLTSSTWHDYVVDHVEGNIFRDGGGGDLKYTCWNNGTCTCTDNRPGYCFAGAGGTIQNRLGVSFFQDDPNVNKFWTKAGAFNGETTQTTFVLKPVYTLTVNKSGSGTGVVTGAGKYDPNSTATATAMADAGSTFSGWSGDCSGASANASVNMNSDKTCTATFTDTSNACPVLYADPNPVKQGSTVMLNWSIRNSISLPVYLGSSAGSDTLLSNSDHSGTYSLFPLTTTTYTLKDSAHNPISNDAGLCQTTANVIPNASGSVGEVSP